jgi:peptidoglycan hydrolase-like protein with peptidoglycan-binding domain
MATAAVAPELIFPGHVIGLRDPDTASVTRIQRRLNQLGCGPIAEDGDFGPQTQEAVALPVSQSGFSSELASLINEPGP